MSKIIKIEKIERCGQCKYYHEYYSPNIANGIGDRCEYPGYPSQQAWKEILPPDCPLSDWPRMSRKDIEEILRLTAFWDDGEIDPDVWGMDTAIGPLSELIESVSKRLCSNGMEIKEE